MLRASDSVRHSFIFVFDRIRSVMASADDNAAQLPADAGFLTPPSRVVTRGAFRGIPCRKGQGRLVSRDELRKLVEHGRAPHPDHNPAQPGRITAWNATIGPSECGRDRPGFGCPAVYSKLRGIQYYRFLNIINLKFYNFFIMF